MVLYRSDSTDSVTSSYLEQLDPISRRKRRLMNVYGEDDISVEFWAGCDGVLSEVGWEDPHPADKFVKGQKTRLMTLPEHIRDKIFAYVARPYFNDDMFWRLKTDLDDLRWLTPAIRSKAIESYYGHRHISIDLPDFQPHALDTKREWPSEIHFHDQYNDLSFWALPSFLSNQDPEANPWKYMRHNFFKQVPFHLFASITINIPPPIPGDAAQLIMNWNRLRFLGRLLAISVNIKENELWTGFRFGSKGLPPIKVMFQEDKEHGRSWFDRDGTLTRSITLPAELAPGHAEEHLSDLVILVRALAPVRGCEKFDISPALPERIQNLAFSTGWITKPEAQTYRFGEYLDLQWSDLLSFHWLTRCALAFHKILLDLDTPTAPFLRLEQVASASHYEHHCLKNLVCSYVSESEICQDADRMLYRINMIAYILAPDHGISIFHCNERHRLQETREAAEEWGPVVPEACHFAAINQTKGVSKYQAWEEEFLLIQSKLLAANGLKIESGKIVSFSPPAAEIAVHDLKRIDGTRWKKGTAFKFYHDLLDQECPCWVPQMPRQLWRGDNDTKDHRELWLTAWPNGINYDEETLQTHIHKHHRCKDVSKWFEKWCKLPTKRRQGWRAGKTRQSTFFISGISLPSQQTDDHRLDGSDVLQVNENEKTQDHDVGNSEELQSRKDKGDYYQSYEDLEKLQSNKDMKKLGQDLENLAG